MRAPEGHCEACYEPAPSGANFCEKCGKIIELCGGLTTRLQAIKNYLEHKMLNDDETDEEWEAREGWRDYED